MFKDPMVKLISFGVGIFVLLVLVLLLSPFVIIGAGERGVVMNLGKVQDVILGEGIHWQTPIVQSVKHISVRTTNVNVETSAYSRDTQVVDTKIVLNYHPNPASVNKLYQEIGSDYEEQVIVPKIHATFKDIIAQYTAQELLDKRPEVTEKVRVALNEELMTRYLTVDSFDVTDFSFSEEFEKAVEAKQVAVQQALKAENDLKRVEQEAKQKVEQAKADAEAIRIQAQAINSQGGADYVALQSIQKWNGKGCTTNCFGAGTQMPVPFFNVK